MVKYIKAFDPTQKTYFKRNYGDAIAKIVPGVYLLKDVSLSGVHDDPLDSLLKTHITAASVFSQVLNISATPSFPEIDNISGISRFFVKQDNLTRITPFFFERDLIEPLKFTLEAFDTSTEWKSYLENSFLPAIKLNEPSSVINTPNGEVEVSATLGYSGSALHEYYLNTLGWFYILNTSAPVGGSFAPSSYVLDKLNELFLGKELYTIDGVKGFEEYLWKNYPDTTLFQKQELVPVDYLSGTEEFTSGTQNLDRLKVLTDILYSDKFADDGDFKVKEEFENYITFGSFTPQEVNKGPFSKLLRVLGYAYQDVNSPVEELNSLYDIDRISDDRLPYLADLIGWDLIGSDPDRWRSQIRNAVRIYKAKGTTFATQLLLNSLFGENSDFSLSSSMYELYESYVPFLIYYLLATGTPYFNKAGYKDNPFDNWTLENAKSFELSGINGVTDYSSSSIDSNIRRCVDHILKNLWIKHPNSFLLGDKVFPKYGSTESLDFIFNYRGRDYPIPPFEEIRYYEKAQISNALLNTLQGELTKFDVNQDDIATTLSYIRSNSISAIDDIAIGNKFVLFTSAFHPALNFSGILSDISNKSADYLPLWNAKSSHFDLHLVRDDYVQSKRKETVNTTLGITNALKALNKTIPAHAIPRVKLFLSAIDGVSNFIYACPTPLYRPEELFTSSTVVNGWETSGVEMNEFYSTVGLGHGLSSTANSRKFVDSITDIMLSGAGDTNKNTKVSDLPRNNLRRRNLKLTIPRDGVFDRTGFDMPNSYSPSSFDQFTGASGGGALNLGYNYSAFAFQTPFFNGTQNPVHPVWFPCETSTSPHNFFGIDTSNTFPWRGAEEVSVLLDAGKCLLYTRREELPEIMRVMHQTMEKDAYRAAYEHFKEVSGGWNASSGWMDPIQSLANSGFNGVSSWDQYADYTFGSGVHQVYNYYAKEFGRHGTAPHLVSGELGPGGRNIFSHIYGPLLYNGKFEKDGSAVSMVASAFDISDYSGVTEAVLIADSPQVAGETNQLILGTGYEYRYPFAFSGVEFCYNRHVGNATPPKSAWQCYRTNAEYGIQNPQIETSLIDNGLLQVSAQGNNAYAPRIRFSLNDYGSTTTSANLLLPEHNFSFSMNLAKYQGQDVKSVWVWIHTMPEDGYFWSWIPRKDWNYSNNHRNGEWVATPEVDLDGGDQGVNIWPAIEKIRLELGIEFSIPKTNVTSIDQLKSEHFNNYSIDFNTSNKQYRDSGKFLPHPKGYTPRFVHRSDQKYVVEVMCQTTGQGFATDKSNNFVFKNISIIDKTLANTALDEYTVSYQKGDNDIHTETITRTGIDEYRVLFKYMNSLATSSLGKGYSTRIAADSSGIFEASGGSRLNYRYHPKWGVYIDHAAAPPAGAWATEPNNYTLIDFKEGIEK